MEVAGFFYYIPNCLPIEYIDDVRNRMELSLRVRF